MPDKDIDQKRESTGLEPVGSKLPRIEQKQQIKGIVDGRSDPFVAVVQRENPAPIQTLEFRCENLVQVLFGVSADGL